MAWGSMMKTDVPGMTSNSVTVARLVLWLVLFDQVLVAVKRAMQKEVKTKNLFYWRAE